jgi:hypothetical protein
MFERWTFTNDPDPGLIELRRQLLSRSETNAYIRPLRPAYFEVRAVSPSVSLESLSLCDARRLIDGFVAELAPEDFPPCSFSLDQVDMDRAEMGLWGGLVAGVVCEAGVFGDEPDVAADWVLKLLIELDEKSGSRHFYAKLHSAGEAVAWFIVTPMRVAMVCLVGWD